MISRRGEVDKHWYRSDRFFVVNNQWYFTTREKLDIGPFGSEEGARQGLQLFIKNVKDKTISEAAAAQIALRGQWSQTLYH